MANDKSLMQAAMDVAKGINERLISTILKEEIDEASHQVGKGATELAAALFSGTSNAFVMYPRQGNEPEKQVEQTQAAPEQEQKRGGRQM